MNNERNKTHIHKKNQKKQEHVYEKKTITEWNYEGKKQGKKIPAWICSSRGECFRGQRRWTSLRSKIVSLTKKKFLK